MKSKEEYMQEYRSHHPEYWMYLLMSIILDVVGAIIVVTNGIQFVKTSSSRKKEELIIYLVIGIVCWIIGFVFTKLLQSCDRNGVTEYERYRAQTEAEHKMGYQNINTSHSANSSSVVSSNEWRCPTCGKVNQNYVGTCGCGQRKP